MGDLRTWRMDFDSLANDKKSNLDPPGYDSTIAKEPITGSTSTKKKDAGMLQRKQNALYARATAPVKNIAFMCFMAWMSGNSIQIFSIIMTFSLLATPISAILSSGQMFPKEADWPQLDVLLPRILYCLIQCGQIIFGLYKLNGMGLLPVYPSDWISSIKVPDTLEHAYAAS
mmetsp:Transcript_4152/g.10383  ORF Transcript_4152/g.10383 Transcript_4152/m.10383 type:complete len:172 (-) Transcript_4152:479-994(-)|eukprot:CAMPEP_0202869250 /NCGR_PEP_ID=MMETSP1391-20130828/12259_1 /ASSEMBLY_ACC=CAM_ASM_000867 /TAXON_ID=1034604 /ORGANISM="Chlamydomonas leiostraca, Strain SAG 11-49" /LENGTH=171 /DNA_ID=CAMNT_0049549545 /DNA_START=51 /DNA_END=566 /DNA_ORIENTATION=+